MAIDIHTEHLFPLSKIGDHAPRGRQGKKLHASTGFRWASAGLRGHRLETVRIGGTLYTSQEALQRFADRLSDAEPAPTPRPDSRRRAAEQADRALQAMGV